MYYGTDFFVSTQIPITSTVGISPKLLVTLYMYLSYWLHVHYFFRSVTPTELNRRRHLSSTSSFDFDHMDPLVHFKELSMPRYLPESIIIPLLFCNGVTITVLDMFQIFFRYTYINNMKNLRNFDFFPSFFLIFSISSEKNSSIKMFDRNFGRSLLADFSDHYLSNFVLHGTSDTNFKERLIGDLHMATQVCMASGMLYSFLLCKIHKHIYWYQPFKMFMNIHIRLLPYCSIQC